VTEGLARTIGKTLWHTDELVVGIRLFVLAHLWLVDDTELRVTEKLNRGIALD
jgi:hypothetical protein